MILLKCEGQKNVRFREVQNLLRGGANAPPSLLLKSLFHAASKAYSFNDRQEGRGGNVTFVVKICGKGYNVMSNMSMHFIKLDSEVAEYP